MSLKAIGLISGGLDSALVAKVIKLQGIDVKGISFITPFMYPHVEKLAQSIGIDINLVDVSLQYLDLIKNPYFGFGKNLNPCIDCRIFMFKKAKEFMLEYKANFIISGEVLGQRSMSQNRSALENIERQAGLEGLLLRPLSAQLFKPTLPEQQGWVDRSRLFKFSGRSRKPQMELAEQLDLAGFAQPAGGCLLTDPGFSQRLKDLLTYQQELNLEDTQLLKLGRHFRLSDQAKLVLGRNHQENQRLVSFIKAGSVLLSPIDIPGPIGVLKTETTSQELLKLSASILAHYCDHNNSHVYIRIESDKGKQTIYCPAAESKLLETLRI